MNKKIRFSLLTLLVMLCGTVFADYQKVTATSDITDGEYLIVYEGGNVAFDGSLTTLDAASNTVAVTISDNKIASTEAIDAATFTIDATKGTIKSSSDKYIGITSNNNGLTASDSELTNTLSIDEGGNFTVLSSGGAYLRYNSADNQKRFRYYKSASYTNQNAIQLYKKIPAAPSGYIVDFNTAISTSARDFSIASNWGHISGYDPSYDSNMSYSYATSAGVEGTGALLAYRQFKYDWGQSYEGVDVYDILVTPLVKGTVSLAVKQYSGSNSYIEFYKITEETDGSFTRGDKIEYTMKEGASLSQSKYDTVSISLDDFQRIGIRASYMYMDNFSAEEANIIPEKAMTIVSADPTATTGTIYWNQQENGKVLVKYTITVKNTGDVDLTQGTDGFSVSIFNRDDNTVYVTTPVPQDLAVGDTSDPFVVQAEVEASTWPNSYAYHSMDLRENLKSTVLQRAQSHYKAYASNFVFRVAESTSTSSITASESWGTITESTSKSFEIANTGSAPLTIKSITLPNGFTSTDAPLIPEGGLVVAGGSTVTLSITQDATATGTFAGTLSIAYLSYGAEENTIYNLDFAATVIGANTWTADFNGITSSSVSYPAGSVVEAGIDKDFQYISTANYNIWLQGRTTSTYANGNNKFITPKLHAKAGAKLAFDVKGSYNSNNAYFAKVYVSTDRQNWGEPVAYYTSSEKEGAEAIGYSNWVTKTITFDAEGDYYVAFALYGTFKLDNLVGLEKVDVDHDLYIKSVNWPDASIKSGTAQTKPSIDFIPLTDETAENYTVKYMFGETILAEGTPVALTASANSSKTISFNWTPVVEETTVYNGTKVVFEFTDGKKFETETFDLTVTNEAIFHFLNSAPSSKYYEPTDRTNAISFGKTNTEDTQSFVIFNWGSKDLTVNSISLPEGFTTDAEFPMIVPAFNGENDGLAASSKTLNITFSAATAGTFSGDMVITYETDKTFQLAISGTKLDPTKFYANFGTESNQWPAGSVYQSNVSLSNTGTYSAPNYAITSLSTDNNFFITPKLSAKAGDKLMFDAKLYSTGDYYKSGAVKVYAAATREALFNAETRTQLLAIDGSDDTDEVKRITADYKTFEVTVADAGEYFFGFEISGRPYVDELYGLTAVAVENDIKIASSVVPTEAMQNVAATATVNILNFGAAEIAADAYTVKVYVDGEVVGNGTTAAIPATQLYSGNGTQVSASFRTPKVGTFPVYIEVKAGDVTLTTDPVDVTFTEEAAVAEAIEVGTKSGADKSHGPVDWYNNDGSGTNWTDIVYTAKQLDDFGIKAGDKITSIAFKGSGTAKSIKAAITSWVGVKTGDITPGTVDKDAMTEVVVYDQADAAATIDFSLFNIDLSSNPIVWDGTSDIRIYTEAIRQGSGNWQTVTYDYDSNYMNSYFNSTTAVATPLGYFTLAAEPAVFSGIVKTDTGAAVEGATITLVSTDGDNVQYTGATDAEGAYSINVIQANRTYDVTMKAEGYDDQVVTIEFNGESQTKNFVVMNGALIDKYFVNAEMNSAEGWTAVTSDGFKDLGAGLIGTYQVRFSPATVDETHLATEYTFGFEARWAGNFASYTQESKVALPAGVYTLTYDVQNVNGDTKNDTYDSRFFVTVGETKFTDEAKEWMAGATSWTGHSLRFAVNEDAKATISMGYGTGELNYSAEITPAIYVSHLALSFKSFAEAAIDDLNAEIAIAEGMLADASKTEGREVFAAAIETAKALRTSDDVAAINAGVETLKAAELAFRVANLPVQEGTYYVYNAYAKKFLSRGDNYGVRAVADDFGLPFNVTVDMTNTTYKLQMYDSKGYYGDDYWMYSDCSGNRVRSYSLEKVDGGFYLHNSNRATVADNRMYVYMKDDADKWAIAGNAIVGDNVGDEAQTVWQFVTAEQRNAIIAANAAAQKTAAFTAAGIAEDATLEVADATELTFKTGSAWIYTAGPNKGGTPGVNDNGTELYQATGNFAQTVENLESGLYKVSIQAFYRGGGNGDVVAAYGQGHDLSTVSLYANGTVIRVNSWAADRAADNNPNSMGDAAALFAEGKYLADGYAFVGEDKTLSLKVFVPSFIGAGWFIASNVKYAKVDEAVLAGDANLDDEVTASDAILAVSFALETETPSPKAFKAADVNASGNITVSDAVGIVNIALSEVTSEPSARGDVAENNALALNGNVLALANTTEFVAFQMDVTVAEGTQFRGVELTSRAAGLNVTYNRVADNTYRVVAFSVNKNAIEAGEGAICTFDIVGNKNVQVTNIEFADAAARAYALVLGETTRINGIAAGAAGAEYYSVGGVKSDKAQKGMNVVRTADGKVKKVLVK